ncbi:MAG: hypothetical protein ACO3E1_10205 [Flavobacteriales bacterium]
MKSLHKLIHNLSPSEKRYIKLRLASSKADSELTHYFDAFIKQRTYDIDSLEKEFKKSAKLLRANFGKLYATILKNLRLFHVNDSPEYVLRGMLSDVQLLLKKGMTNEAKKSNEKLIELAREKELCYILVKAYSLEWMLHHVSGTLNSDMASHLQKSMDDFTAKHIEIELLTGLYRKALVIYNDYFFIQKTEEAKKQTLEIIQHQLLADFQKLSTDQSKMIYCEIMSIHYWIHQNMEKHHEIRKLQFEVIFNSKVYEDDYTNKVLVAGHLCSFLVYKGEIKKLKKYFEFFTKHFANEMDSSSDGVFIEKYYDVYFQCKIYLVKCIGSLEDLNDLVDEVHDTINTKIQMNDKLVGRTLWSLAEALIMHNQPKRALKEIINFQDIFKNNMKSNYFLESEIGLIIIYHLLNKDAEFDRKIKYVQRKIKAGEYVLEGDQKIMIHVLKKIEKRDKNLKEFIEEQSVNITRNKMYVSILKAIANNVSVDDSRKHLFKFSEIN